MTVANIRLSSVGDDVVVPWEVNGFPYNFFGSSNNSTTRLSKRAAPPPSMLR
jgi:hypothetical protein